MQYISAFLLSNYRVIKDKNLNCQLFTDNVLLDYALVGGNPEASLK